MKKPASAEPAPAKATQHHTAAAAEPPSRRPRLKEEQEITHKPGRYASPPCYLAELADEDFGGETSK